MKVLLSICQQIWKTQQWPQDWKRLVCIPIQKEGNAKKCSNYCTIALISHTNKVMLKILQARLQRNVNCELTDVQAGFRKGRGTEIKLPTSVDKAMAPPLEHSCLENPMNRGAWWATVHGVAKSWTQLSDFTFTFHFHALEKEMATHSNVLAWRIPGMQEPCGLVYGVCEVTESDMTEAT